MTEFNELLQALPKIVTKKWVKENIKINKYINIVDKYATSKIIANLLLNQLSEYAEKEDYGMNYVYIKYDIYTNMTIFSKYININIKDEEKTSTNYDLIFSSGLFDIVMETCKNDYDRFIQIIDRMIGIEDFSVYREISRALTSDKYFERLEKSQKILNKISLKKYETLKQINDFNNPIMKQMLEVLKNESNKEAREKIKKEGQNNGEKQE